MTTNKKSSRKQTLDCDWSQFQEHLKANIPWIVYDLKVENNKYLVSKSSMNRYVSRDDIQKWQNEKLLYIIKENDDKWYSILLRHQFPEKEEVEESAEYVPLKYQKHGGIKNDEKPNITKDNPQALKEIMKRESNQAKDKNKNDQKLNKDNQQSEFKIVNQFVFEGNDELKRKFKTQYDIFEKENK
ncbi:hypothetical protein TTHERM_00592670 (macronuclear) [Tetrahymena thermophila SB210]|uniref:Uncharacterized protein n=1 Tax=Tetrahymena thermophila (strain SB210) TaxID=312017 RepID=Q232N1_TETTS|nr:hypothetical protein TTHERM_00592670 [Tetrahymena thermophila SB210]EAR91381.1 hypothetical protein TTHERM_00592670 [Tetrahymena thermophila SB210]|eukprot:XP_001011626.1 hypothetical protein TTHERM_00592670 [Tetrahymena thermophila SB210]